MKRTLIGLIILFFTVSSVGARTIELTIYPAKAPEPVQKYQLLPRADEQTDADAAPLYDKAIQALPNSFNSEQINRWRKTPPAKLPLKKVQSTLEKFKPTFELVEQAGKCKKCDWPYVDEDTLSQSLGEYRKIAFALALQVNFQIAQGQCDNAVDTIRASFAMARHLASTPAIIRGLVGVAVAAVMCQQVEQLIQVPDAANLYWALQGLPRPFIDLTEQARWEDPDAKEKIHLLMNRLDRHVALLQCIEAIRLFAAGHDGQLPEKLSDITEVAVPNDPVTRKPFVYRCTGSDAALEGSAPKGGSDWDAIQYKLNLKE